MTEHPSSIVAVFADALRTSRRGPQRIVCMTEETTEFLYAIGEDARIVGVSGYTVRPPPARHDKPRISAFTSAKIDKILELQPDLVLAFSDMQADIVAALIRAGVAVHTFNQRSVAEIFDMMHLLGGLIGQSEKAARYTDGLMAGLQRIGEQVKDYPVRPRVYFEEWDTPQISGIEWVSELMEWCGGVDIFPELRVQSLGKNRIIADPLEVVRRAPDIIIGSWCGKKFRAEQVAARPGWGDVPAVKNGQLFEIKSPIILQPGPAVLTEGVQALHHIIGDWVKAQRPEPL
jgi:iron complex transport system substrate-binding protein